MPHLEEQELECLLLEDGDELLLEQLVDGLETCLALEPLFTGYLPGWCRN